MVKRTRKQRKQKGGMRSVARILTPFALAGLAQGQTPYPTLVPGTIFRNGVTGRHYLYDPSQGLQEVALATPSALPTTSYMPTAAPTAAGYQWPNFSQLGNTLVGATRKIRNSNAMRQFAARMVQSGSNALEASKQLPGKAYNLGSSVKEKGLELGESTYRLSRALANNLTGAVQSYLNPDGSVIVLPSPSENENDYDFLTPGPYKFQTYDGEFTLGRGILGTRIKPNSHRVHVTNFVPSPNLTLLPAELFSKYFPETSEKTIRNALEKRKPIPSITIHLMQNTPDKSIWLNDRG